MSIPTCIYLKCIYERNLHIKALYHRVPGDMNCIPANSLSVYVRQAHFFPPFLLRSSEYEKLNLKKIRINGAPCSYGNVQQLLQKLFWIMNSWHYSSDRFWLAGCSRERAEPHGCLITKLADVLKYTVRNMPLCYTKVDELWVKCHVCCH